MPCQVSLLILLLLGSTPFDDLPRGGGWREFHIILPDSLIILVEDPWLVENSPIVLHTGDTLQAGVDYTFDYIPATLQPSKTASNLPVYSRFRIEFTPQINGISPGDSIIVGCQSARVTDRLTWSYYTAEDAAYALPPAPTVAKRERGATDVRGDWSSLWKRGVLRRGVRFEDGSGEVSSGMNLELSGRPAPGIGVDIVVDDSDLPAAGGGSTALSDLDRVLFRVQSRHVDVELGDWDLDWKLGRFGAVNRQLKGGSLTARAGKFTGQAVAAGGSNSWRTATFFGRDGDQGPYELTDRFGRAGIGVASGSETVYMNGLKLTRGRIADYYIDYVRGAVYFNPSVPIRSDSRIEVEYEYNDESYPRSFYGANLAAARLLDGKVSLQVAAAEEARDSDRPLTFEWTGDFLSAAAAAGDSGWVYVSGIDSLGPGKGDYVWETDAASGIVRFSDPDSLGRPTGYLRANFSRLPGGEYVQVYDASLQMVYYRWKGDGGWAPFTSLPLPDRTRLSGALIDYKDGNFNLSGEVAVTDRDLNLLSNKGDDDNVAGAWEISSGWGVQGISVSTLLRREERGFSPLSRAVEVDHLYRYGLSAARIDASKMTVEGTVEIQPVEPVTLNIDAGYINSGAALVGRRGELSGVWRGESYRASAVHERVASELSMPSARSKRSRWQGRLERMTGKLKPMAAAAFETLMRGSRAADSSGYEYAEGEIGVDYLYSERNVFHAGINYRSDDRYSDPTGLFHWSDTRRFRLGWEARHQAFGAWSLGLLRHHQTFQAAALPVTTTSAVVDARVDPRGSDWRGSLNYNLRSGSDRAGILIASYIGGGKGGWRREGDRYVPDEDGDFQLREALTDSLRMTAEVDLTSRIDYEFGRKRRSADRSAPPLGISGASTRFEAAITTTDADPLPAFVLHPDVFHAGQTLYSRYLILQDVDFLTGSAAGDGRLTLRRERRRDMTTAGGETTANDRIAFRVRRRLGWDISLRIEPSASRDRRTGITLGGLKSEVNSIGVEFEIVRGAAGGRFEYGIGFGRDSRRDRKRDLPLTELRLFPHATWNFSALGSARLDGDYRRLASPVGAPGYDLDRGWRVGKNYTAGFAIDYRIAAHLTLSAYYRGKWLEKSAPRHQGMVEFAAQL